MDNEVAVVGSGIAGLSCAYKLSKNGFRVRVFEKEVIAGGRAPKAIRIVSKQDKGILSLLQELNYTNMEETRLDKFGSFSNGKTATFTQFKPLVFRENDLSFFGRIMRRMAGMMTHVDLRELRELQEYINSLEFSLEDTDNRELKRLHGLSIEEWLNNYSENLQNLILKPMILTLFETDLGKSSARNGVRQVSRFFNIIWNGGYIIEGGPYAITQEIIKSLRKSGNDVDFLAEVTRVEETSNGFEVTYEKSEMPEAEKGEETEKFKYVVLAVPLTESSKILKTDFGIPYVGTRSTYVTGELKQNWGIVVGPEYNSNFRVLFTLIKGEQYLYPINPENDITNIGALFKNSEYRTLGVENIRAVPRIQPKIEIPSLEYEIDNIFLCGDFYYYANLETAVETGMMVADKIMSKKI